MSKREGVRCGATLAGASQGCSISGWLVVDGAWLADGLPVAVRLHALIVKQPPPPTRSSFFTSNGN